MLLTFNHHSRCVILQAIAIGTSLGISLISGGLCGFVLKRSCFEQSVRLFNDAEYFEVPTDDGSGLSVVPAAYASGTLIQNGAIIFETQANSTKRPLTFVVSPFFPRTRMILVRVISVLFETNVAVISNHLFDTLIFLYHVTIRIFSERAAFEASKRAAADAQSAAQKAQVYFAQMPDCQCASAKDSIHCKCHNLLPHS